ncbi:MAG: MOSC domain-containing protein [Desertimonas sp.]
MRHLDADQLAAGLAHIRASPTDDGILKLVVARPSAGERHVVAVGELSLADGLIGDNWNQRPSRRSADGGPHPDMQLNLINARLSAHIAEDEAHRALCGDQLHVDLDLSVDNLPPGTRLAIGDAVIEITDQPHTGCAQFRERFGGAALRFVNTGPGKQLRLRGINAKVVEPGRIAAGDAIRKVPTG